MRGSWRSGGVWARGALATSAYHVPPISFIAFSKAFLLSVRASPLLRGRSGRPSSALRRATRAPISAMSITASWLSALNVFEAIIACAFFSYPAVQIRHIGLIMKDDFVLGGAFGLCAYWGTPLGCKARRHKGGGGFSHGSFMI